MTEEQKIALKPFLDVDLSEWKDYSDDFVCLSLSNKGQGSHISFGDIRSLQTAFNRKA